MKKKDIIDAWATIRKENSTIPDEVLDLMKDSAIKALEDKPLPNEDIVVDAIVNSVFIRGIELENYKYAFTEERSGLISTLAKIYK